MNNKILYTNKFLFILLCLILNSNIFCTNLISLQQKSKSFIDDVIGELINSEKSWNLKELVFKQRYLESHNRDDSDEYLTLKDFNCTSDIFSPDKLIGQIHKNEKNKVSSIEINSLSEFDFILLLKFEFNYEYKKIFKTGTEPLEKSGRGWLDLSTKLFNYLKIFTEPDYTEAVLVDSELNFIGHELDDSDERISKIIDTNMKKDNLQDIARSMMNMIKSGLEEYNNSKDNDQFTIITRDRDSSYTISQKIVAQPYYNDNRVTTFIEGTIIDEEESLDDDSSIAEFVEFDPALTNSKQLFLHKKFIVNLFNMSYEKKIFSFNQEKINLMKLKNLNKLDINFLRRYYPALSDIKPLDAEFYFEFYVDSVNWNYNGNTNPLVKYTFYFISVDDLQLLVEFNLYVYVDFDVEEMTNPDGGKAINFVIKSGNNLKFDDFKLLAPKNVKFDSKNLYILIQDFMASYYEFDNYMLFKFYEDFNSLIAKFDTVKKVDQGWILYNRHESEIKFLQE